KPSTGANGQPVYTVEAKTTNITPVTKEDPAKGLKPGQVQAGDTTSLVTGDTVAKAINSAGFTLKTSGNTETPDATELITPGKTLDMVAGKNMTVRQDPTGKVTFATSDVVDFTQVTTTDAAGNKTITSGNGLTITPAAAGKAPIQVTADNISMGGNQIHDVAAGTAPTDAVNVSQLRGEAARLDNRIDDVGAQGAALGALKTLQYDPLEPTQIMAGYGYYGGSSALALGVAHYKNESTLIHAGASMSANGSNKLMANAGITWKVGSRSDETAVADRYRQGPISSAYALQDEVTALKAQNASQSKEIAELKAMVQQLMNNK
ncbi:MAG: YadA-like family protein, partial [Veillonella sp.]|nr:YadA-like family protein [Veillonella sp.]